MQFEIKKNGEATILKIKERKLDASVSPELKGEFLVLCNFVTAVASALF
jgi:hypothetical protein